MYGKHYVSTYTGSLVGAGLHVFSVWGYVIANTSADHLVELNAKMLAFVLGGTQQQIEEAIKFLCSPDKDSRTKEHDGRRLIREGEYLYRVVNHEMYRNMRDNVQLREYMRVKKRESRERAAAAPSPPNGQGMSSDPVKPGQHIQKTDTDTETYTDSISPPAGAPARVSIPPAPHLDVDPRTVKPKNALVDREKLIAEAMKHVTFIAQHEDLDPAEVVIIASKWNGRGIPNLHSMGDDRLAHTATDLRNWVRKLTGEAAVESKAPESKAPLSDKAKGFRESLAAELQAGMNGGKGARDDKRLLVAGVGKAALDVARSGNGSGGKGD